jgi:hypothetical protein
MEFSTTISWLLGIHGLVVFFVSLSVLSCPFRFGTEKFGLFLLTWLVPFIGSIFVQHHFGTLSIKNLGTSGGSTIVDIPPSSGNCDGGVGGEGGGCD